MITEDYVSFETAKLLEEKEFPVKEIQTWYCEFDGYPDKSIVTNEQYPQITLQMAMKWLREKYNLHIITLPYAPIDRHPYHPGEADVVYIAQLFRGIIPIDEIGRSVIKLTHEEACEAAIKYCLTNLI